MENILSDLAGKTFLVTGASSGMGAATALALGQAGANVVLAARRVDACEALVRDITWAGGKALAVKMDVAVEADVREAVARAVKQFGRLDGAFNNAGLLGTAAPLHEARTEDFEAVMRTNVMGVFWSMKYEIAAMLQANKGAGGGAIVNNASIVAQVGFAGMGAYTTSKHGVMGLTRTAALEYYQQGIRINAVLPGPVETPMSVAGFGGAENLHGAMASAPAGRAGQPEEVAKPVLFLLSSAASYISGQGLTVDGGYTVQ
ncbi:MAG TPA: SDR family oxidoreductase [Rhodocyclaceae bacterium]|nr:SDR family oxidoreductase [Rhodocyclaceae bacterium]